MLDGCFAFNFLDISLKQGSSLSMDCPLSFKIHFKLKAVILSASKILVSLGRLPSHSLREEIHISFPKYATLSPGSVYDPDSYFAWKTEAIKRDLHLRPPWKYTHNPCIPSHGHPFVTEHPFHESLLQWILLLQPSKGLCSCNYLLSDSLHIQTSFLQCANMLSWFSSKKKNPLRYHFPPFR